MTTPQLSTALSVSVKDAAVLTSFSEYEIRNAIDKGEMAVIRRGRRIAIPVPELTAWLQGQIAQSA
jgi:hypothetical protein